MKLQWADEAAGRDGREVVDGREVAVMVEKDWRYFRDGDWTFRVPDKDGPPWTSVEVYR